VGLLTRLVRVSLAGAALVAALGPSLPGQAAERVLRYSGRVERVDLGEGLVVVDELAARGQRRRHELYVAPDTAILTTARARPWAVRAEAFEEMAVSLVDVITGDFVVVESTEESGRPIALRIVIVEAVRRSK
jgi:endonuclease YncB( thermonuclease family)